jgi:hypothetical protein
MSTHALVSYTPYLLFAVAALSLFALGTVLARGRAAAPERIGANGTTKMMSLMDAANAVYDIARREQMVIVTVAEKPNSGGAVAWFAQSIAGVLPIYCKGSSQAFERLDRTSVGSEWQSLYIQKRDFQTYVRWARSMQ